MKKALALSFIQRIEAKRTEEARIWDEMRDHPDYESNEDKSVREIIDNRTRARAANDQATADLNAFDLEFDEDGDLVEKP